MTPFEINCPCGTQLLVKLKGALEDQVEIHCQKCQRLIFPESDSLLAEGVAIPLFSESSEDSDLTTTDVYLEENFLDSGSELLQTNKIYPPSNQNIDQFEVLEKIGEGGMGEIFLAQDSTTQEKYVIKTLKLMGDENQEKVLDYFLREAQVLMSLSHPSIVQFKGCGNVEGIPYFAMEFIKGKDLKQVLLRKILKVTHALPITYHITLALEYALTVDSELIHRDIKPANIFIPYSRKPPAKLIDFGLAKGRYHQTLARQGAFIGTPHYMSQEQIFDAKNASHQSDIYSLGATLYHMLAGVPPYAEHKAPMAVFNAVAGKRPPVPLEELRPRLPKAIYQTVEKMMAYEPSDRYSCASELKQVLTKLIQRCT